MQRRTARWVSRAVLGPPSRGRLPSPMMNGASAKPCRALPRLWSYKQGQIWGSRDIGDQIGLPGNDPHHFPVVWCRDFWHRGLTWHGPGNRSGSASRTHCEGRCMCVSMGEMKSILPPISRDTTPLRLPMPEQAGPGICDKVADGRDPPARDLMHRYCWPDATDKTRHNP
jgi:hypothetical protein